MAAENKNRYMPAPIDKDQGQPEGSASSIRPLAPKELMRLNTIARNTEKNGGLNPLSFIPEDNLTLENPVISPDLIGSQDTSITPLKLRQRPVGRAMKLAQAATLGFTLWAAEAQPLAPVTAASSDPDKKPRIALNVEDPQPGKDGVFFPETGNTVANDLYAKWLQTGGLAQNGLPLGPEVEEVSPFDGKKYRVQYFERARFERHPEFAGTPNYFLLGQLGREQYNNKYPGGAPGQTEPNGALFQETNHKVGTTFMKYWESHGGLAQQGFPISGEFMEKSPYDGKEYRVQYFERARFEYHPENAGTPYEVLLGQVGREQWDAKGETGVENPNWRKEFGDPNKIMFYNKTEQYGAEELKINPQHSIDILYAAIDKYFPGKRYEIHLVTDEDILKVMQQEGKQPSQLDYDPIVRWSDGQQSYMFYTKGANGNYVLYASYPQNVGSQSVRNEINSGLNYLIFTFPYKQDNPWNKAPQGYGNTITIPQVLAPYNDGKGPMDFAFGIQYKTDK